MRTAEFEAQVVAAFGRHLRVRDASGAQHDARPFGRKLDIVCGDRVRCQRNTPTGEVHAVAVMPRTSALYGSSARGGAELVDANLDLMAVVVALLPRPDFFVMDRYLAAAACARLHALVVLNKCELIAAGSDDAAELESNVAAYARIGYPVVRVSARQAIGVDALAKAVDTHTGVLVGQSGVGKSSLMRLLAGAAVGADIATGALGRDDEGIHTTTAARMYACVAGGRLIDSPGVRDFAPSIEHLDVGSLGFIDVDALASGCRFNDCRHMREPACAVRAAAESGAMQPRRYESYRRLRRLVEDLHERRGPKGR